MYKLLFLCLFLSSCGPHVVDVNHKIEIDLTNLEKYFITMCEREQPEAVQQCKDEKMTQFFELIL